MTTSVRFVVFFALLGCWLVAVDGADKEDLVTWLPQQPAASFKQYAGYVTLDPGENERALFYWFLEADHVDASSLPVALWLQGGPGCSSIGYGAFHEVGPFIFTNGTLHRNKHAWNKEVNLIFLDSPVGTGFSYSRNDKYNYTDHNIAVDTYQFLVGWFQKFPEYSRNALVLLGESFAGHYVPNLAAEIIQQNKQNSLPHMNFKGFMIGNPSTDAYSDNAGTLNTYLSHSLISEDTFDVAFHHCNLNNSFYIGDVGDRLCDKASSQIAKDIAEIDIYNVYRDHCNQERQAHFTSLKSWHRKFPASLSFRQDPCAVDAVIQYLNSEEVQKAFHVQRTPVAWTGCSNPVFDLYSHKDMVSSMLSTYTQLLRSGIKIWIYSGDWDARVPTLGTRYWIKSLGLPPKTKWHPWEYRSQVGGWTQVYMGLTFTTVRGAGHMAPSDQPGRAVQILRSFLAGKPLPKFHLSSV